MPPIIEEEEPPEIAVLSGERLMMPENFGVGGNGVRIEELPDASSVSASACAMEGRPFFDNQERALVLFKPVNTPFLQSSPLSVSVDSDIMSGLKSKYSFRRRFSVFFSFPFRFLNPTFEF